jgi:hypothetical protein
MKRRNVLRSRAEKIARRTGIDRRQARQILKELGGDAPGRGRARVRGE